MADEIIGPVPAAEAPAVNPYPLATSREITPDVIARAGICNGMQPDVVMSRLEEVLRAQETL